MTDGPHRKAPGRAKGGIARAKALDPEKRRQIAIKAAASRWDDSLPLAEFGSPDHPLKVGDFEIPCYVLNDGRRVLIQRGMMDAMDMSQGTAAGGAGDRLTRFVATKGVSSFVSEDLAKVIMNPITFRTPSGSRAYGYEATVLADLCDAVLIARKEGTLNYQAQHIADRCEMLVRAFAKTGIIALVDEATGYQEVRDKHALQAILDAFLRKELATWAKRFPDEFYEQIFRLRKWQWKGRQTNPPQVVAHYTKDLVYARLAPAILEELERRNPKENGRRRVKHHQWLTEDVGHPALAQHLHAVITLMRVATTWDQFKQMIDIAHPRRGDTLQLPLMSDFSPSELPLQPSQ